MPQRETRYYRIDGTKGTFETWDENNQRFMTSDGRLTLNANTISYSVTGQLVGPNIHSYDFNRSTGRVVDEFNTQHGAIKFEGDCSPVRDPKNAAKRF